MQTRAIHNEISDLLTKYPAVALIGPRSSGKTTLARLFSDRHFDLERRGEDLKVDLQWEEITESRDPVILDEAQEYPYVFSRLRGAIDNDRKRYGRFLLPCSAVSPHLIKRVPQSLAGRLAVVELTPLLLEEVGTEKVNDLWLYGGYPEGGILQNGGYPGWQRNYLSLMAQRDLPNWGLPASRQVTQKLFSLLAADNGREWNASETGKRLGVSYHTANSYLLYLEGAFLIRRLQPFYTGTGKRLSKRSKVYWRDSGLLHSLLKIGGYDELAGHSAAAASWEGFVIEQILGALNTAGVMFDAFHLRADTKRRIDLILKFGRELWAVNTKLTTSPSPADLNLLDKAADLVNADRRILITQHREFIEGKGKVVCDLGGFLEYVKKVFDG